MRLLSESQLNTLDKEALIIIVSSLQDQIKVLHDQTESLHSQLDTANAQLSDTNRQIELLTEQIRIMNQRQFGRKSESLDQCEGQMSIFDYFNGVEALANPSIPEPEITEVIVSTYRRSKTSGKREADLEGLPARIFEHTLSDEELSKLFPEGYKELPCDVYKRLHIIPETFIVDEHHVHVYASKKNTGEIYKAKRPKDLFRNSIATASLLATILNAKYTLAVPLERQSKAYKANGINLSSNTMANWVIKSSEEYFSLIYDRLHKELYNNKIIHADESPVKVMRIDRQSIKNGKKTYMWVYRNKLHNSSPIVLFDWQPSRRADHPREFLKDFSGTLITDGYQVYHKIGTEREDLKVGGCWIHARRPFAEFIKSVGEKNAKGTVAYEAYCLITQIMHEDNKLDDLSSDDRLTQRQLIIKPMVDAYFAWVKSKALQVTKNSKIGKALSYSIHQEKYLRTFLNDGDVPMDNNAAEQAIRPFTLGRKNFVLIESDNGAKASAMIYSLVETAKANNLNPHKYFELLLNEFPNHMDDTNLNFLDSLLPWSERVQQECHNLLKNS